MSRAHLRELLHALSAAFQSKDVEALLRLFSTDPAVTYAGSEFNEKATGPAEVRALLSELLGRPATYSFDFGDLTFSEHHGLVWLLADGQGTETRQDGTSDTFPYRLTGVLTNEESGWRWLMLAGSEPTPT